MSARPFLLSEEAIGHRLEAVLGGAQPDPLFARRLRGTLLNRHVAVREGMLRERAAPHDRQMGRLGRACLVTSVALLAGVATGAAAAQESLPGDALHSFKLQIEAIRMSVAPQWMRDDLASIALAERLGELERLLSAGEWERAEGAATAVVASAGQLMALEPPSEVTAAQRIEQRLMALQVLIASAPEAARGGLEQALNAAGAPLDAAPPGNAYGQQGDAENGGGNLYNGAPPGNANGQVDNGANAAEPAPDPTPRSAEPKGSKKPKPTPKPVDDE